MRSIIPNLRGALASVVLLVATVLTGSTAVAAQESTGSVTDYGVVTINVETPGTLAEMLAPYGVAVRELTVTGTINAADFEPMKNATLQYLQTIDLSGATIEGNAIPDDAFCGNWGGRSLHKIKEDSSPRRS